ncbi:hypothetical protein C8F04DRAFT_1191835 [Mycena alexandri]|uniref:Uncharacterized protein n=1 Tax=Mycena alexandri TaxID=1745969 RepID=A0AAD6SD49_9AGAR|nr:hypothetical protein C8F04DRAFT_1191835 [Mycena alexandri]
MVFAGREVQNEDTEESPPKVDQRAEEEAAPREQFRQMADEAVAEEEGQEYASEFTYAYQSEYSSYSDDERCAHIRENDYDMPWVQFVSDSEYEDESSDNYTVWDEDMEADYESVDGETPELQEVSDSEEEDCDDSMSDVFVADADPKKGGDEFAGHAESNPEWKHTRTESGLFEMSRGRSGSPGLEPVKHRRLKESVQ